MTMSFVKILFILVTLCFTITFTHAANFYIQNNCSFTVWAAAVPGGGRELRSGQTWLMNADPNFSNRGRVWARTNCDFNGTMTGKCESGDCDGSLYCESYGTPPSTLAEFTFNLTQDMDFLNISLVNGFNIPMEFIPASGGCASGVKCTADINRLCPTELRGPGGCHNPCTVFKNEQFCCTGGGSCEPTAYSKFFKDLCPNVYTYPFDDATGLVTCPTGSDYRIVFCP